MNTIEEIQVAFETLVPVLRKRLRRYAKRFSDADDSLTEMMSSAWINFRQKALKGVVLPSHQLAFVAFRRLASGRTLTGYSVADALAPAAYKAGRCRRIFLSELTCSKANQVLPDSAIQHITHTLSTREWDTPLVRAMTRLDWAAFMATLEHRQRRIVHCLVAGFTKTEIAERLKLSCGRITQILYVIGDEVREFFGPENVPAGG